MRHLSVLLVVSLILLGLASPAVGQTSAPKPDTAVPSPGAQGDEDAIRQLEAALLNAEMNTDPSVIGKVFADDWANLAPSGPGPAKAEILERYQEHAGQAPPYTSREEQMQVYLFGDAAVAAYVKVYVAKENRNIARQDMTDVFIKSDGVWKLRITRTSPHAEK